MFSGGQPLTKNAQKGGRTPLKIMFSGEQPLTKNVQQKVMDGLEHCNCKF